MKFINVDKKDRPCPICGTSNLTHFKKVRNWKNFKNKYQAIMMTSVCVKCEMKYSNPLLNQREIDEVYINDYVGDIKKQKDRYKTNKRFRRNSATDWMKYIKTKNIKLLEIGCSSGYNLANILEEDNSIIVKGVDLDKESIKYGKSLGLNLTNEDAFKLKEKFDVIMLSHILEHISDPISFLNSLKKILKSDGKIVINTPDALSKIEDPSWEHVNYFSMDTFKKMITKSDYHLLKIESKITDMKEHRQSEILSIISLEKPKEIIDIKMNYSDADYRFWARKCLRHAKHKYELDEVKKTYKEHTKNKRIYEWLVWHRALKILSFNFIRKNP